MGARDWQIEKLSQEIQGRGVSWLYSCIHMCFTLHSFMYIPYMASHLVYLLGSPIKQPTSSRRQVATLEAIQIIRSEVLLVCNQGQLGAD